MTLKETNKLFKALTLLEEQMRESWETNLTTCSEHLIDFMVLSRSFMLLIEGRYTSSQTSHEQPTTQ